VAGAGLVASAMCMCCVINYTGNTDLPQNVSASGCHLQGFVAALEAIPVISVLWVYKDSDPSSVASCRG
jgi:hypothetical protein